jgi:hypothetical protein
MTFVNRSALIEPKPIQTNSQTNSQYRNAAYAPQNLTHSASPAPFKMSAVFLIATTAPSQSPFSIASRTNGKTEDSSPL